MKKLLLILSIITTTAILLLIYCIIIEPNAVELVTLQRKVPTSINECRIIFFSDTHLSGSASIKRLERVIDDINSKSPDVVIFGGDFFDNYYRDKSNLNLTEISAILSKISAKYAKFAVYGNHDYGGGAVRVYEKVMSNAGFSVIRNESILVNELNLKITGLDDFLLGDISDEMYQPYTDEFNLIISHAPDVADNITAQNALVLSGHSHGGQVKLPIITKKIMPKGAVKYNEGLYSSELGKGNNFWLFVSKGVGMSALPIRFLTPPDIVLVELTH